MCAIRSLRRLTAVVACWLAPPVVAFPDLELLQWNPHWQCEVWNQKNCAEMARAAFRHTLERANVDFANLIELETGELPGQWTAIASSGDCGLDKLRLVYNNERWTPSAVSAKACAVDRDRPFVIQEFIHKDSQEAVIVVGAHFPHPFGRMDEVGRLHKYLSFLLGKTATRRVVLLADTNEEGSRSSQLIAGACGIPGRRILSTDLVTTCCADLKFQKYIPFDRIIANFGERMETRTLFSPIPDWAIQVRGLQIGGFHRAVLGTLRSTAGPINLAAEVQTPVGSWLPQSSPSTVAASTVVAVAVAGIAVAAVMLRARASRPRGATLLATDLESCAGDAEEEERQN